MFRKESLYCILDMSLEKNRCDPTVTIVWKILENPVFFRREFLKMPSDICSEKNPCNASLVIVYNGIFVKHSNICLKNVCNKSQLFV